MEFTYDLTVRFNECDLYGHVNHAVYLHYLESARVGLFNKINLPLLELKESGFLFYVVRVCIEYIKPAQLDDGLRVLTKMIGKGKTTGVFKQEIFREQEIIASADVKWVWVNTEGKPTKHPGKFDVLKLVRPVERKSEKYA